MHEMSLAEGVLQLAEDTARREKAQRIKLIVLEIGRLSLVEPEALSFCFEAVARGSMAQGAGLEIIDVPGAGWCMLCAETVPMQERYDACPSCGHPLEVTSGTEMLVREVEIE